MRLDRGFVQAGDDRVELALFAHAHFLRILGACWIGLPPIHGRTLTLGTASISVLGYERETRVIQVWNQDWRLGMEER